MSTTTASKCRAKQPAFCSYHGVPQPAITYDAVKSEIKKTAQLQKESLKKMDLDTAMKLEDQTRELKNRLKLIRIRANIGRQLNPGYDELDEIRNASKAYEQEIKEYRANLVVKILGKDTPFIRSLAKTNDEICAIATENETSKQYRNFNYYVSNQFMDDGGYEKMKARELEAETYAKEVGADGVVKMNDVFSLSGEYLAPYKLEPGQIDPKEHAKALQHPKVKQALREVDEAIQTLRSSDKRKISNLSD